MGKYKCANSVEEIKNYIGDSCLVAFDFETAPDEQYRGEDKAALDPAKKPISSDVRFRCAKERAFMSRLATIMEATWIKISSLLSSASS